MRAVRLCGIATGLWLLTLLGGCGESDDTFGPTRVLLSTEGEHLNAYDLDDGFKKQAVVTGGEDQHAGGISLNGQICLSPDGSRLLIAGDDAGQPAIPPGWGVLRLSGNRVGDFSVTRLGKLTPTYIADRDNYGCAFLPDGRLFTTDIGNNASGPATGQLILWFPPLDVPAPRYCKLDVAIGTAGGIHIDEQQRVYVASAREAPGIYRYTGPFPTSDTAAGGCGGRDSTGAPLADTVTKERFLAIDSHIRTPNSITGSGHGTFYVSSVLNGVIAEYDAAGVFVREILRPAMGDLPKPYKTGSPFGLRVDAAGTLYYADLGLVVDGLDIGPQRGKGTVRRIRFVAGVPQAPEVIDMGLNFPDGLGLLVED